MLTEADTLGNKEYPAKLRSPCAALPQWFDPVFCGVWATTPDKQPVLLFRYRSVSIVNDGATHLIEEISPFTGEHRAVAADSLSEALEAADHNRWTPVIHSTQPST